MKQEWSPGRCGKGRDPKFKKVSPEKKGQGLFALRVERQTDI